MRQPKQLPAVRSTGTGAGAGSNAKLFAWQQSGVRLMQAPWVHDAEKQQFGTAGVSVAEESTPQYALTFTVTVQLPQQQGLMGTSQQQSAGVAVRVVRKVTKQHMANAFERAVSSAQTNDFAQLRTRSIGSSSNKKHLPQQRDVDDAVRQWLLQGKATPTREEIVLWLLSRMVLAQSEESGEEGGAWNLLICGEQGAEHIAVVVDPLKAKEKPSQQRNGGDQQVEENDDEEELPDYEERLMHANEIDEEDDVDDREASDTPPLGFDETGGGGDEHAALEDQDPPPVPHKSSHGAWAETNFKHVLESTKKNSSVLSASTTTAASSSTLGLKNIDSISLQLEPGFPATQPTDPVATTTRRQPKSQYAFEPASTRIRRRSATSHSSFDADLTNEWTQDRKSFQLELSKSRKDIQAAKELQRKTEAIMRLRKQQLLAQSQRKLRAHDQKREDSRHVTQLVADTLEYHELLHTLETQVKRTKISAKREQERLSQTMRVAIGRGDKHVKGPILGTGPLSQLEMDALTVTSTSTTPRDGHEVDTFIYDLHGRRHSAEDAGDVVALGVFESAMRKIKRVLDSSKKGDRGSTNNNHSDLLQTFRKFDTNRSGTLSRDEFANVLLANGVKLTKEQAHVFFAHFDPNGSGEINYGELLWGFFNRRAFLKKWQQKRTKLSPREIKLLFYQYDRMGCGALSVPDFQLAMEHIGFQLTESELKLLVLKFDANQDGYIDYHEFHAFVNNGEEEGDDKDRNVGTGGKSDEKSPSHRDRKERGSKSRSASLAQYQRSTDVVGDKGKGEESVEQILRELRALSETQMKIRQSIRK